MFLSDEFLEINSPIKPAKKSCVPIIIAKIAKKNNKNNKITTQNLSIYEILDSLKDKIKTPENKINDSEIIERCILTMINEASKCLEENVVKNARYLDMAMIMGAGFPAFRGGGLRYADKLGLQNVVKKLQNFEKKYGERFVVSKLLLTMAENNQKFYN